MLRRFGNEAKFIEHYACISDGSSCRAFISCSLMLFMSLKFQKHHSHLFLSITSQQQAVCRVERQSFVLMNM